jgi:hypothetical protein
MASNKSVTHWKSAPGGPGSGVVAHIGATGMVVYNGRLEKGPHAGKWIRLCLPEDEVIMGDTDKETRHEMEHRFGGARSSDQDDDS